MCSLRIFNLVTKKKCIKRLRLLQLSKKNTVFSFILEQNNVKLAKQIWAIYVFTVFTCCNVKLPVVDDVITFLLTLSNAKVITAQADYKKQPKNNSSFFALYLQDRATKFK